MATTSAPQSVTLDNVFELAELAVALRSEIPAGTVFHLGTLRVGEMRELSTAERGALLSAAQDGADGTGGAGGEGARKKGKRPGRGGRGRITAGRPGDGKGAKGMHGIARPR